jgi:hypothetical protein
LAVAEIVNDDDWVLVVDQLHAGVRTDVTRAARNQDCHFKLRAGLGILSRSLSIGQFDRCRTEGHFV